MSARPDSLAVACLCHDDLCSAEIELTLTEYEAVEKAAGFAVAPGHPLASGDRVLTRTERYSVVRAAA